MQGVKGSCQDINMLKNSFCWDVIHQNTRLNGSWLSSSYHCRIYCLWMRVDFLEKKHNMEDGRERRVTFTFVFETSKWHFLRQERPFVLVSREKLTASRPQGRRPTFHVHGRLTNPEAKKSHKNTQIKQESWVTSNRICSAELLASYVFSVVSRRSFFSRFSCCLSLVFSILEPQEERRYASQSNRNNRKVTQRRLIIMQAKRIMWVEENGEYKRDRKNDKKKGCRTTNTTITRETSRNLKEKGLREAKKNTLLIMTYLTVCVSFDFLSDSRFILEMQIKDSKDLCGEYTSLENASETMERKLAMQTEGRFGKLLDSSG